MMGNQTVAVHPQICKSKQRDLNWGNQKDPQTDVVIDPISISKRLDILMIDFLVFIFLRKTIGSESIQLWLQNVVRIVFCATGFQRENK